MLKLILVLCVLVPLHVNGAEKGLPPIANPEYVSSSTHIEIDKLEKILQGELVGYYFVTIFDGLWPIPSSFALVMKADNKFNQYGFVQKNTADNTEVLINIGLNEDLDPPLQNIEAVTEDNRKHFERYAKWGAFPEGYKKLEIDGVKGYYGILKRPHRLNKSDDYLTIFLWNENEYMHISSLPDGQWQAMFEVYSHCKQAQNCLDTTTHSHR